MADLFITLIGFALFVNGMIGVLHPGKGKPPGKVARALQIGTGLIMMAVGLAFAISGLTSHATS